jgi:hypothetical protein
MMAGMPIEMFIEPEQDPRAEAPTAGSELDTLTGFHARHNGHADLLRERIDGAVGQ